MWSSYLTQLQNTPGEWVEQVLPGFTESDEGREVTDQGHGCWESIWDFIPFDFES